MPARARATSPAVVKHLTQEQLLTGALSSLNQLLVDKGIIEEAELQQYMKDWMKQQKLVPPRAANGRKKRSAHRRHSPRNT